MASKRDPQFPDMTDISTLEYLRVLEKGGRITRKSVREYKTHNPVQEKPKAVPPAKRKWQKGSPEAKKKRKKGDEDVVPPSPGDHDEELDINYLTACVWGPSTLNHPVYLLKDSVFVPAAIAAINPSPRYEYMPAIYGLSGVTEDVLWVDIRKDELLLASDIVALKEDDREYQLVASPGGPVSPHDLYLISLADGSTHRAPIHALKPSASPDCPQNLLFQNWLKDASQITVSVDNIDQFVLRFVSVKTKKETKTGLLLRFNEATGKVFLYVGTKFKWERVEHCEIVGTFAEPPVPLRLLSNFTYETDLIRVYRTFYQREKPEIESERRDEAQFRKEVRCTVCKYILDELEYRECGKCGECTHVQCLEEGLSAIPLRGTWRCANCPRCENCFSEQGKFFHCLACNSRFHEKCIDLLLAPNPAKVWKCENCAVCQFCHVRASQHSVKWNDAITMCHPCETKWKKKEFCPKCQKFWYFDGDRLSEHVDPHLVAESQNMIQCDRCQMWIHNKCDPSVSAEDWAQYSVTGNTKKYYCPDCTLQMRNDEMGKIVRELMVLDPQEFFHHYVDDQHYNKVIRQQMCFDMMLEAARVGNYAGNPTLLKDHFRLICDNAMCYYKTNANGYVTAQKLLKDGMEVLHKRLSLPATKKKPSESRTPKPKKQRIYLEKQLLSFSLPLPTSLTKPESYDFETDRTHNLSQINFQPPNDFFKIVIMKKDIQPYLRTRDKPALYLMAMSVTYTDFSLNYVELCYICSSFISKSAAWLCRVCGRAFHEFCKDQERTQTKDDWRCKECRVCEVCKGTSDFSTLIYCCECGKAFDMSCLWPHLKGLPLFTTWRCDECFVCERCGVKSFRDVSFPADVIELRKDQDFSRCYQCSWVLENKQYCPVCDEDWSSPYSSSETPKERYLCKHCGFAFHRGCVDGPWKGGCPSCLGKNMDFAEAEQTTIQQVQTLMELVSQINFYKSLCKDEVEKRYNLPSDFAKMLSNFFLIDNSEFMSTNKDIKRLFQYRGVDIVKKQSSKEACYKTTTIPLFQGLRRSDVPSTTVPEIRLNAPGELLPLWSVAWDTSAVVGSMSKFWSPIDSFSVVKEKDAYISSDPGLFSAARSVVWDFGQYLPVENQVDFEQVLCGTCYWWALETEVRPVTALGQGADDLISLSSSKFSDPHIDVLTSEIDPHSLATQYVNHEVPTALALTHRFEKWLRGALLKLTLHELNRNRQEKTALPALYSPRLPDSTPVTTAPTAPPPQRAVLETAMMGDDIVPGDATTTLMCVFCKREGERKISGRLLPSEEGLWAHANCGFWSVDIEWLQECGGLLNFPQALTRSKKSKCSECGKLGATLICSSKKCHGHFHFQCAVSAGVRFFEPKTIVCEGCGLTKDLQGRIPLDREALARLTQRKLIFTTGKRYARKPPFIRHEFNRIGSLILCAIPEEGVHEQLESLRLTWLNGGRALLRCSKRDNLFRISDASSSMEICHAEAIEDLWPRLKLGDSFHLRCAADFFGYSCISNYLPPFPETASYFRSMKEKKPRTLQEILDTLHSPQTGASLFIPFDKHRFRLTPRTKGGNTKSTHLEDTEVVHKKDDVTLASEYRKYKKTTNRDEHLEVLRSPIHGLGLFTTVE